jgi:hypothetical protein
MKRLAGILDKGFILVLLALGIIISSSFQNSVSVKEVNPSNKTEATSKKASKEKEDQPVEKLKASEAIVHIASVSLLSQIYFIFEFKFDLKAPQKIVSESIPLGSLSYFRTLFSFIISPNAP